MVELLLIPLEIVRTVVGWPVRLEVLEVVRQPIVGVKSVDLERPVKEIKVVEPLWFGQLSMVVIMVIGKPVVVVELVAHHNLNQQQRTVVKQVITILGVSQA